MKKLTIILSLVLTFIIMTGCYSQVQSVSGTKMTTVGQVKTDPSGKTIEQSNVANRINMDNQPGSVKHLYVMSAYSGQVLIYSTVKGKVTSSGKRLTPDRVNGANQFNFSIGHNDFLTDQVLGEDGTYGSSIEYLYWWDTKGVYHQHYIQGGQILHISDQPLAVKSVVLNMEITQKN